MLDSVRSCWPYLFRKAGEHHRESERERKAARGSDCDLDLENPSHRIRKSVALRKTR